MLDVLLTHTLNQLDAEAAVIFLTGALSANACNMLLAKGSIPIIIETRQLETGQ